ncbi:MAG TPA: hypothetical protein VFK12_03225 [Gammaproteobacteria bacterium]|nr:hypothetical protein [Gammaproteobacteria bacterium]
MLIVILITATVDCLMLLIESRFPGRNWPVIRTWLLRALAFDTVQGSVIFMSGLTWNHWLARYSLLHLATGHLWLDAAITYLAITFVFYWWRRWRHELPHLWLWLH